MERPVGVSAPAWVQGVTLGCTREEPAAVGGCSCLGPACWSAVLSADALPAWLRWSSWRANERWWAESVGGPQADSLDASSGRAVGLDVWAAGRCCVHGRWALAVTHPV